MKEQLGYLVEIQDIDKAICELKEKKRRLPEMIEEARRSFDTAKANLEMAKTELDELTKKRREKERELDVHEEKITKLKGRLNEVKTNKEYQAHLIEIESAAQEKGRIEEELLTIMENLDSKTGDLKEEEKLISEEEKKLDIEITRVDRDIEKIGDGLKELGSVYQALSSKIEESLLNDYLHLKAIRKDIAVVPIKNGACLGCLLQLPPQLIAEAKKNDKIMTCSYCHRILYWPPHYVETSKGSVN